MQPARFEISHVSWWAAAYVQLVTFHEVPKLGVPLLRTWGAVPGEVVLSTQIKLVSKRSTRGVENTNRLATGLYTTRVTGVAGIWQTRHG